MNRQYLGIDIGGTAVKIGLVTEEGEIRNHSQYPVAFDGYETPILETVLKSTDIFLDTIGLSPQALSGIGISATGQIDTAAGTVAGSGGNIRNWEGSPLKEAFSRKYHLPVTVVNDANCVALGEQWLGSARGASDVIVLTIGTGLGGGIIVNNQILLGQYGYGGEIGHFSIQEQGLPCTCGNTGCFEQYASMTALVKKVTAYYNEKNPAYLKEHTINGITIFQAVENGDAAIVDIVDSWITHIAAGITSLVHIFNPQLVIIGGGVCTQETLFVAKLRDKVLSQIMPNFRRNFQLLPASLGNMAGLAGAVCYFMNGTSHDTH